MMVHGLITGPAASTNGANPGGPHGRTPLRVRDGVAYVTFNRPQARNALTFAMYERLAEICDHANGPSARSGRSSSPAPATRPSPPAPTSRSSAPSTRTQDALAYEARIDRVMTALERCRVPTIAAIDGACTGGGARIAACCDLRIASRAMKFGFPVARTLGNCLSMRELQPARRTRRPGAGEGHRVPRAADRSRRGAGQRTGHRDAVKTRPRC